MATHGTLAREAFTYIVKTMWMEEIHSRMYDIGNKEIIVFIF